MPNIALCGCLPHGAIAVQGESNAAIVSSCLNASPSSLGEMLAAPTVFSHRCMCAKIVAILGGMRAQLLLGRIELLSTLWLLEWGSV